MTRVVTHGYRPLAAVCATAALLLAAPTQGQSEDSYSDVPDRFRVEIGGFRIGSDTELTFNTSGGSRPPVNFESLDVPENTTRFYVEGFWRPGRRHQVSLSWYRNSRDGDPKTVEREFAWGDRQITVGSRVTARVSSYYLSGVYRFAAYRSERFEVGPCIGIGYLSIGAGIDGEVGATTAQGTDTRPFDLSSDMGQPTGTLGGYFDWWAIRRLMWRGEMRYIFVSVDNADASIVDGRTALLYHPWRNLGVGLQYTYTKFKYERDIISTELGGHLRYSGGQLVVSAAF